MSTLVERLRPYGDLGNGICNEAADEIEQLTRAQRECSDTCCELEDQIESLEQLVRDLWAEANSIYDFTARGYFFEKHPEHRERIERLTNEN